MKTDDFDCIVIGAGHAGIEAAHAAARIGVRTCLLTLSKATIAKMSCNPAIGGLAKGQITREVDALGGLMGLAIDATGIQFRMLNRSKGPAVQSPRAQADKYRYQDFMRARLEETPNLTIVEGMAAEILTEGKRVCGIRCMDGTAVSAPMAIITTGTFLRGIMHIGTEQFPGGRLDEPAANDLSASLERLGLELRRLKTGTPVRLDTSTIDLDRLEAQHGDPNPVPFSFLNDRIDRPQIPCWITYTNEKIHQLIRDNLHRAPLYTGQIKSVGPRYCPSIETKIMRFADKDKHQVFLEPEDEDRRTIYCNGISTSLPKDVQEQMLRLMPGTENARIVHYAYAIEYDYCPPVQLQPSLETRKISGLFLAGQINGTSGYEEAAAQGLWAALNVFCAQNARPPFILRRDQAYMAVLVDDLVTRGTSEPYRMFTSRAEYRLLLREGNADARLTPLGRELGLVDDARHARFAEKARRMDALLAAFEAVQVRPDAPTRDILNAMGAAIPGKAVPLSALLRQPQVGILALAPLLPALAEETPEVLAEVETRIRYQSYLEKEALRVSHSRDIEDTPLPQDMDYAAVVGLTREVVEKLARVRPASLGQAGRISGVTPAAITCLEIHLHKAQRRQAAAQAPRHH